jgi:exopolysaccharide biosynthesis polyprenyl glycosylphosphotransferase
VTAGARMSEGTRQPPMSSTWERHYTRQLMALDAAAIVASLSIALLLRFGSNIDQPVAGAPAVSYVVVSTFLAVAWFGLLVMHRCYETQFIGAGSEEFQRVGVASARLWTVVAITCYVGQIDLGRGFVAVAFPLGVTLLWAARWTSRRWLRRARQRTGGWSHRMLVMGDRRDAEDLVGRLLKSPTAGYHVTGVCLPGGSPAADVLGVPVVGSLTQASQALAATGSDTVAVTAGARFTAPALKRLSWELAQNDIDMVVAPTLTDIAGPRIHVRPVDGLPLLHIAQPEFSGPRRVVKEGFDRVVGGISVLLLLPVFVAVAGAIRFTSSGPVMFRQRRIGKGGKPFTCYKFRTMVVDAEDRLGELLGDGGGQRILFKLDADPRITRVGHALRRFSLDELPQLFNVVKGDMSLVGPRPQVQAEVDLYTSDYRRRLLVKPGITGLWQVSGRSDLSYEESERLDLYYVENWSLASDLLILWQTLRAVVAPTGAY